MTEKKYRFQRFDAFAEKLQDKRIVLYGTGMDTKEIIESYPRLQIVGVMEKTVSCAYIYGKKNLLMEELISLRVDAVIIVSVIEPIKEIYNGICSFCHANHIGIYDMYGDDLFDLFFILAENQRTLCDRNENVLRETTKNYDIISIDLFDTLLNSNRAFDEGIWWQVAEKNIDIFPQPLAFLGIRKEAEESVPKEVLLGRLEAIYSELQRITGINEQQKYLLMQSEKECRAEKVILDRKLWEILYFAKECGKEIVLISESYFSERETRDILEKAGVREFDVILSAEDYKCTKSSGLFRMVDRGGKKWLHIGENEIMDGVCPLIYGIDIFLLNTAEIIHEVSSYKDIYQSISKWYREGKVDEMLRYGGNTLAKAIVETELSDHFVLCDSEIAGDIKPRIENLEQLHIPSCKEPIVSIIIPVYNQFLFTYNCLLSILCNTNDVSYEVIIADDYSTDETASMGSIVEGVRILHNKENLGFLRNCNQAAKGAKGKYILFLNNDTYVQPQWLLKLLSLMESREDIGMVGSKLIYPDGRLQEAGGIVWEDASAWNYGYGQNAGTPVYNYVREVDYISGAAIMIKTKLWQEIGGFDTRFAPAYYEDTDLAFEVRKRGFKVMYHPFSIVVHYEGISNGTDINTGLKAYQAANKDKFYEKWRSVLEKEHFKNGDNVFIAKDRSRYKKHILVVDHYVPQYDSDAGGRCTYMYLKLFLKMGMEVTFIGDRFEYSVPYTQELLEMGIEILYGAYYKNHIDEWLEQNLKYFDYIYLQRPHISIKYIDMVKKWGRGKIIYFAHDLHHVRLKRQYDLTGDDEALFESQKWEKIEYELFDKADVGHVVGDFEQQYVQKMLPAHPIRNIPIYIYEDTYRKSQRDFQDRKDILYVGGFGHPPNLDAVLWFAKEVFPKILEKYPDIRWHIVGNKPTPEIMNLANDNIIIEGFVSDKKLEKFYNTCRLSVVPLRVGAGVKGKVIEAAYYQLPVVTTDVGAEGISTAENALIVENNAEEMADKICALYENFEALAQYAENERKLIENHYLIKNAMEVLRQDIYV